MTDANASPLPGSGLVSDASLDVTSGCDYTGHAGRPTCKACLQVGLRNPGGWPSFVLAEPRSARYTFTSKAAGPLPQGMLSLGGSFFSCGGGR